jgi:predicted nucleic-acid-binding protein
MPDGTIVVRAKTKSILDMAGMLKAPVVLELEWVLRFSFGFAKDDVLLTLSSLLSTAELTFESERAREVALHLFRDGSADFADCLHVALATQAGEQPLWTSDKGAAKVNGAWLLVKA